jgi:hypothetical protein
MEENTENTSEKGGNTSEPFTDVHERCSFLDGLKKMVDLVGNVIEDIPQAWRHGKAVETKPGE